jgi:preprotein translocase subunit YajC
MDVIFFLQDPPAGQPSTTQPAKEGEGAPQQAPPNPLGTFLVPLVLMFVVMYFLMLRPQRKQQKEREAMLANLKKNDHVVTASGLYGIVKQVRPEDTDLVLCIDEDKDVRVKVAKSAIAALVKPSGASGEAKAEASEKAKG